jgi:type IV secretion system protein VirB10
MSDNNSPVDDGKSAVAGTRGGQMSTGTKFGFGALMGALALAFIWMNALYSHKNKTDNVSPAAYNAGTGAQFEAPPPVQAKPPPPVVAPLPTPAPAPASTDFGQQPQQNPATAPIMAFEGSDDTPLPASQPASTAPAGTAPGGAPLIPAPDDSPLAQKLKPTVLEGETASVMQNPDMTITEGTIIPCILQTAIDSQLPGLVTCTVPMDIRGATGNVVLLDHGTRIVGELQNGLMQGQNRVFVDWTRAETPDHVIITLDSPGTDELGRSGLPGAVDNHFLERFGGALLLTLVQGALEAGTVEAAGQGGSNSTSQQAALGFVYSAQSNGQSIANTALSNTINIPPTLTKNQGDTVALIVAHDLDFSSVYQLHLSTTATNYGG